jgi:predicted O-methyltransferase YrrM
MLSLPWRRALRPAHHHPETLLTLEQTATERRFDHPFLATYPFRPPYINAAHEAFTTCPTQQGMIDIGIPGWLLPADALKLYELAYYAPGDVLELGTYRGLSAHVIRQAIQASPRPGRTLISIDLDPGSTEAGRASVAGQRGAGNVHFFTTSADEALETFTRARRKFALCFIDHSHRYEHVRSACERLPGVLLPGSFCLFHDYNDPRNACPHDADYGVFQAVSEFLPRPLEPWGVYGCCGLFRFGGG